MCCRGENWSWSAAIWDKIKGCETKAMKRLFRFKRKEEKTLAGHCTRNARAARIIWKKMKLTFLCEMIAEIVWTQGQVPTSLLRGRRNHV